MAGSAQFTIEKLSPQHDRAAFSCGVPALDRYLHQQARQDVSKRVAAAFVLTPDGVTIAGYHTLSQYSVTLDSLPEPAARVLPKYPNVPVTLLGRLAVSLNYRGQGLGELLLFDAIRRSVESCRLVASAGVLVNAKDDSALRFYLKYGFLELRGVPNRLFLPMGTAEQAVEGLE